MSKYINADELINQIDEYRSNKDNDYADGKNRIINIIHILIAELPSADVVEVKHGEWTKGKEILRTMLAGGILHIDYENFKCSNCGLVLKELLYHTDGSPFYKFCPNCGANMRERKEIE